MELHTAEDRDKVSRPIEFLSSQFPGFAAESLADVYFANGGDLNLTVEMFNQLEIDRVNLEMEAAEGDRVAEYMYGFRA